MPFFDTFSGSPEDEGTQTANSFGILVDWDALGYSGMNWDPPQGAEGMDDRVNWDGTGMPWDENGTHPKGALILVIWQAAK